MVVLLVRDEPHGRVRSVYRSLAFVVSLTLTSSHVSAVQTRVVGPVKLAHLCHSPG